MAEPELHPATLREKTGAGGGLVRLVLEPPAPVAASYVQPGQYVVAAASDKKAYLVLAGDPGDGAWELLVRPGGAAADAILASSPGQPLGLSAAQGKGFPLDEAKGQELLVVVMGSGLAAARPVLRARVQGGQAASTELFVGVRTPADLPLDEELTGWARAGARVVVCLSRRSPHHPAPPGLLVYEDGYAQDVAARVARAAPQPRRLLFAAGVKPMIEAIRGLARDLGVHESDVRTNY